MLDQILNGISLSIILGIIYGLGATGLSLILRYLKFIDLTTFVSLVVGSIAVISFSNYYASYGKFVIVPAILFSILVGGLLGFITAFQIVYCKIPPILAGILTNTAGISLEFFLIGKENGGQISFKNESVKQSLSYFIDNSFTWCSFVNVTIICIGTILLISYILFRSKLGIYMFGLLGSENYLEYRHRKKNFATISLLVIANAIVGFSGALAGIHERNSNAQISHPDFLIIALASISLGDFIIKFISNKNFNKYLDKDTKITAQWYIFPLVFVSKNMYRNDEESLKIFITLLIYVFVSALINFVFMSVVTKLNFTQNYSYIVKASFIFLILGLIHLQGKLSSKTI